MYVCVVLLQWIPAQVGISGNEIADHLFKLDDDMIQPVVGSSSKGLKAHPHERNQFLEEKSRAKWFWKKKKKLEQLAIPQQRLPIKLPKRTTSAIFQLATCHDYLQLLQSAFTLRCEALFPRSAGHHRSRRHPISARRGCH
ncbi:uncharacterized protein [Rhodnius prolixus]|uniref:uncharacterized protein n=1 Tax=Rhodnius prolixus TaxID=13249 RepID=UPI003D1883D0